jgi:hypothetical protein
MCKCVLPPGVNPIAVEKHIDININKKPMRADFPYLKGRIDSLGRADGGRFP